HLLEERIERLVLHGEPFQCYTPVDKTEIDEFFDILETTSNILSKKKDLQQFMQAHCRYRQYVFQPIRLPDDVFNSLNWLPDPIPST
ncbi:9299_t:CDS:2, partial [Cetraspora pellucida]